MATIKGTNGNDSLFGTTDGDEIDGGKLSSTLGS